MKITTGREMKAHHDYYTVLVPLDAETDPEKRANIAFIEAEERTRVYHSPCEWRILWDNPTTGLMRVKRTWWSQPTVIVPTA